MLYNIDILFSHQIPTYRPPKQVSNIATFYQLIIKRGWFTNVGAKNKILLSWARYLHWTTMPQKIGLRGAVPPCSLRGFFPPCTGLTKIC